MVLTICFANVLNSIRFKIVNGFYLKFQKKKQICQKKTTEKNEKLFVSYTLIDD